ncbi:MAG: HigA family addiction module antidote protein [Gammaproteobacteria bacterium]|nr:HigA family addiction module antidote protein [Gammaproteobacteria bacterium]
MAHLHPGKVLFNQYLRPNNLSQNRLARAIKVPPRRINEIILGKRAITADTATRLGCFFGNSASYWMHIQAEYDLERAREKIGIGLSMIQAMHMDEARLTLSHSSSSPENNGNNQAIEKNIKRRIMR